MQKNLMESLKEKKRVVKLSMAALVSALTVCGGVALCSVSAMKPSSDKVKQTADSTPKVQEDSHVVGQPPVDGDMQGLMPEERRRAVLSDARSQRRKVDEDSVTEEDDDEVGQPSVAGDMRGFVPEKRRRAASSNARSRRREVDEDSVTEEDDDEVVTSRVLPRSRSVTYGATDKETNELRRIQALLEAAPAKINEQDKNGQTLLHKAIKAKYLQVIKYLLGKKADINVKDKDNRTALHWATKTGNNEILRYVVQFVLSKKNADEVYRYISEKDFWGRTPFHLIAKKGTRDLVRSMMDFVVAKKGIDVAYRYISTQDVFGANPFCYAVSGGKMAISQHLLSFVKENKPEDAFEYVSVMCNNKSNILHWAVKGNSISVIEFLLNFIKSQLSESAVAGYVNAPDEDGVTPLHSAAEIGNIEVVKLLEKYGADFKARDNKGNIPLHYGVATNDMDLIKYLSDKGGNEIRNKEGKRPLDLFDDDGEKGTSKSKANKRARHETNKESLKYQPKTKKASKHTKADEEKRKLKDLDYDSLTEMEDSEEDQVKHKKCKSVSTKRHDVSLKDQDVAKKDQTAANVAHNFVCESSVRVCNPYPVCSYPPYVPYPSYPMMWPSMYPNLGSYIPGPACPFEQTSMNGNTQLHTEVWRGDIDKVQKLLLEKDVLVDAKNAELRTPLHLAVLAGRLDAVKVLVRNGADLHAKDMYGYIPLGLAIENHRPEIVEYLESGEPRRVDPAIRAYFERTQTPSVKNQRTEVVANLARGEQIRLVPVNREILEGTRQTTPVQYTRVNGQSTNKTGNSNKTSEKKTS